MKIKFIIKVQEMTNGFLKWNFDVIFTLFINNEIIFEDQERLDAEANIDQLLYPKDTKEKIKSKMYESMHDSISKIFFTNDYTYSL